MADTTIERIAEIKARLSAIPVASWQEVNSLIDAGGWSMEMRAALHQIRCEIASSLNGQLLAEWLTSHAVPESEFVNYGFDGVSVYKDGEVITELGGYV